jgi:hypothetical protein
MLYMAASYYHDSIIKRYQMKRLLIFLVVLLVSTYADSIDDAIAGKCDGLVGFKYTELGNTTEYVAIVGLKVAPAFFTCDTEGLRMIFQFYYSSTAEACSFSADRTCGEYIHALRPIEGKLKRYILKTQSLSVSSGYKLSIPVVFSMLTLFFLTG